MNNKKIEKCIIFLIVLLTYIGLINIASSTGLRGFKSNLELVGEIAIASIFLLSFILIIFNNKNSIQWSPLVITFLLLLSWYFLATLWDPYQKFPKVALQLLSVGAFFTAIKTTNYPDYALKLYLVMAMLFVLLAFAYTIIEAQYARNSFIFANPNGFSSVLIFLTFPFSYRHFFSNKIRSKVFNIIIILVCFGMIYTTSSRSALGASACVMVFIFLCRMGLQKSILRYAYCFGIPLAIGTVFIYVNTYMAADYNIINEIVREQTSKSLFSGREVIWPILMDTVKDNPILGLGSNAVPWYVIPITLSSHNLYLQVALQVGLTGLSLLTIIFGILFYRMSKIPVNIAIVGQSYLYAILLMCIFEVSLFQNNLSVALFQIPSIALALNPKIMPLNVSPRNAPARK